jgi:DNA-binding CsgD family transcriptional regulator
MSPSCLRGLHIVVDLAVVDLVAAALTTRERDIAEKLLEAKDDRCIARALRISVGAVKGHLGRMCRKARIPNDRVQLAILLLGRPQRADLKPTRRQRARILLSFRRPGRPDPLMRQKLERVIKRSRQGWSWARMSPEIFPHQKRPKICAAQTCKFAHSHRAELEAAGAVFPDTRRAQEKAQKLERLIELTGPSWRRREFM